MSKVKGLFLLILLHGIPRAVSSTSEDSEYDSDDSDEAWLLREEKPVEKLEEYKIEVKFQPENCSLKAETNDTVHIHYVGE